MKMLLMVGVMVPLYEVPYAFFGFCESTGTIKCGYSYWPLRLVEQFLPLLAGAVALAAGTVDTAAEPAGVVAGMVARVVWPLGHPPGQLVTVNRVEL